jgi:hypothetical protein
MCLGSSCGVLVLLEGGDEDGTVDEEEVVGNRGEDDETNADGEEDGS